MQTLLWISFFIALSWALLYFRASMLLSTGAIAVALIGWGEIASPSTFITAPIWLLFAVAAIAFNVPALRRQWLSKPALKAFRQVMPSMSQTERDALEAGSVWWDGELFSGRPDWRALLDTPPPGLNAEEQAFVDGPAEVLCRMLDD